MPAHAFGSCRASRQRPPGAVHNYPFASLRSTKCNKVMWLSKTAELEGSVKLLRH